MCIRPLHFFRSDKPDEDGSFPGFIAGYQMTSANYNEFEKRGIECTLGHIADYVPVPCGHCPECRVANKRRWVGRCVAEMETSKYSYFVTLTFDNEHLRDVSKRDIQLFIKRLRKVLACRYLAVGEYGSLSNRPHYHLILFTEDPISDLEIFKRSNFPLYKSAMISKLWSFGFSSIGIASASTVAYTVGYLISKDKKTAFKLQSNGLGAEFFSSLKQRYYLSNSRGSELIVALPRYLKEKYKLDFGYDKTNQELIFNNDVYNSGLPDYEYRDLREWLANRPTKKS